MSTSNPTQRKPADRSTAAKLVRLTIHRFRQVLPGTTLDFDDATNVLLGRNGTGKTTLLDLVVDLLKGDLRPYRREPFELEYTVRLGPIEFDVWVAHSRKRSSLDVRALTLEDANPSLGWEYRVIARSSFGESRVVSTTEGVTVTLNGSEPRAVMGRDTSPFLPGFHVLHFLLSDSVFGEDEGDEWVEALGLINELAGRCWRLDEGLDLFRCVLAAKPLGRYSRRVTSVTFLGDRAEKDYIPQDIVRSLAAKGLSVHAETEIGLGHDEVDVLRSFVQLIGADRLRLTVRLLDRVNSTEPEAIVSRFGGPMVHITTRGTTFIHDALSYGEKRLFAFLWHAAANPDVLVADELVNGLHHEWIQTCLDAIQGQAFLTSQNPLLLDHLGFESAGEVQRRFVLCDRDDDGNWIWRNMSQDSAEAFYRAYEVGIQHVSEILETKGLW